MRRVCIVFCGLFVFLVWFVVSGSTSLQAQDTTISLPKCSAAVHAKYTTTGPDGTRYATWHPIVDVHHGCYHDHDHGSNPNLFASRWTPLYNYAPSKHGMTEAHHGFKNIVFDDRSGHTWLVVIHQGTSGRNGLCQRFHQFDVAIKDNATGEVLVDVHTLGDFGKAVINRTQEPLTPPECPTQAQESQADSSFGVRQVPGIHAGNIGYEPWRIYGPSSRNVLGINFGNFTVNTNNPIRACDDAVCATIVTRGVGQNGAHRFASWDTHANGLRILSRPADAPNAGTFYTDPFGKTIVAADDPQAVKQYIKPGIEVRPRADTIEARAWGLDYVYQAGPKEQVRPNDEVLYHRIPFIGDNN